MHLTKVEPQWQRAIQICIDQAQQHPTQGRWMGAIAGSSLAFAVKYRWQSDLKITGLSNQQRHFAKSQGELLNRLIPLVSEVWSFNPCGLTHPSLLFAQIVIEWEVQGFGAIGDTTKTKHIAAVQAQNKALTKYTPNFTEPYTAAVFSTAALMAEQGRGFDRGTYKPFISARQSTVKILRNSDGWSVEGDRAFLLRQGRG